MDSKPSPGQADPHDDGKVVVLDPKEWTDAETALSKLAHVASDRGRAAAGFDFSAGPRVTEPSPDTALRSADLNHSSFSTNRPSPDRGTSRGFTRLLMAACVGAAVTLAWQSYSGAAKQMLASSVPQLSWLLLPPPAENPPSGGEIAVEQPSPPAAGQVPAPQPASAQGGMVAPTASELAASPAAPSLEVQQLETMARDLAAVRQSVEQLAAGQELMAREIAKLQTAGQDIRRRISALPPTPATTAHRPVPPPQLAPASSAAPFPTAPPQPATQSSAPLATAPAQPASPSSALPPPSAASEPQLRPPMPVR
jgi:hypothetical protein